jgi:thiamine pyrophosphate-dependent acetolactate synthase large subunit-like protein
VPVVAIVGQTNRSAMGGSYQQEVDLHTLFKDVASEYVQVVNVPEQLPGVLDRAIRTALAERCRTAIIIPADVQELEYRPPAHAFKMVPSSLGIEWPSAMQMNGLAELITISRYWEEWDDPRLIVAILHNDDLNQVTWEMRAMGGAPKFVESQRLPDVDCAGFARSLGFEAIAVDRPDEIGAAWDRALAANRPAVLDVRTAPDVPPIPPHASWEQISSLAEAMASGDENRWDVLKEGVKIKAQELLTR